MAIAAAAYIGPLASGLVSGSITASAIAAGVPMGAWAAVTSTAATWGAVAGGFAGGFTGALIASGGDLEAAALGGLTGAAFGIVGHGLGFEHNPAFGSGQHVAKSLAHGAVGGVSSKLQGGSFRTGFLSAGATQFAAPGISKFRSVESRVVAASVVGGTVAEIGGGKFANGAIRGAFSRLFNDEWETLRDAMAHSPTPYKHGAFGTINGTSAGIGSVFVGLGNFVRQFSRSVGLLGAEQVGRARADGLMVDEAVWRYLSDTRVEVPVNDAIRNYVEANDSAYFRARVVSRLITGGLVNKILPGSGLAASYGDISRSAEKGATTLDEMMPGLIYGH